jgi:hypothetical protein
MARAGLPRIVGHRLTGRDSRGGDVNSRTPRFVAASYTVGVEVQRPVTRVTRSDGRRAREVNPGGTIGGVIDTGEGKTGGGAILRGGLTAAPV